jgi:hypothetical protein
MSPLSASSIASPFVSPVASKARRQALRHQDEVDVDDSDAHDQDQDEDDGHDLLTDSAVKRVSAARRQRQQEAQELEAVLITLTHTKTQLEVAQQERDILQQQLTDAVLTSSLPSSVFTLI